MTKNNHPTLIMQSALIRNLFVSHCLIRFLCVTEQAIQEAASIKYLGRLI